VLLRITGSRGHLMMPSDKPFMQPFISGTAPQETITASKPTDVLLHSVWSPLLSLKAIFTIVDHYGRKYDDRERRWAGHRLFLRSFWNVQEGSREHWRSFSSPGFDFFKDMPGRLASDSSQSSRPSRIDLMKCTFEIQISLFPCSKIGTEPWLLVFTGTASLRT